MFPVTQKFEKWCAHAISDLLFIRCKVKLALGDTNNAVFLCILSNKNFHSQRAISNLNRKVSISKYSKEIKISSAKCLIWRVKSIKCSEIILFLMRCPNVIRTMMENKEFLYSLINKKWTWTETYLLLAPNSNSPYDTYLFRS